MVLERRHSKSLWSLPVFRAHDAAPDALAAIPRSLSFQLSVPTRFRTAAARIMQRAKRPRAVDVRLADKASFVLGVLGCSLAQWVFSDFPEQMGLLFTALIPPLVLLRLHMYTAARMQLFLLDFCYLTLALVLVHIHLLPCNRPLHLALFSLTSGPLAFAIVAWRNSLVFHSIDKVVAVPLCVCDCARE
jgi:hypothetical protein